MILSIVNYLNRQNVFELFQKFLRFGAVGLSGMIIDFGTTWILKEKARMHKYLANTCGFLLAASYNYVLNRMWTFHSTNPHYINEYFRFIFVSVIGLGINNLVLWFLVSKRNRHFYFSKLIATGITMIWNFGANLLFTFYQGL